ncbi:RHS repeat domain-containing protein [Polaribacter cellanae]|uniref:RHS repeat domain-containing protein n=1 Tax=Polaribacter cellanae TaxID=2818493 RepID=UPI001FB808B7|nr:RHS repeat-associated core domain-containing protein [Polaribacter cellanae]
MPIYAYSKNEYLKTTDIVESKLDFIGKVTETKATHKKDNQVDIITIDKFEYDHSERLKLQKQQFEVNGTTSSEEVIVENTYDALGQLESKRVGGETTDTDGLQKIDYTYNVRGWLKTINNPTDVLTDDLFAFNINYNTIEKNNSGASKLNTEALYNGNISETHWRTKNDNKLRAYGYSYDALNRITKAQYKAGTNFTEEIGAFDLKNVKYDYNGNIHRLVRKSGNSVLTAGELTDILSYSYYEDGLSNRLSKVKDNSTIHPEKGFDDGTNTNNDYNYDLNGNLTKDENKKITTIKYNHLNLPVVVKFENNVYKRIVYTYDATGIKLSKKVIESPTKKTETKYAGNYIYENDVLKFSNHSEGYIEPKSEGDITQGFKYVYQYKDQVNNVRLSYSDLDNNGAIDASTEILHERNYYPFGLLHRGYNNVINGTVNNLKQYQGQEFTEDLGLNTHEWKYRVSDPAIGRFWQIDPLAEDYNYQSPYNFSENRVIDAFELEGLEKVSIHTRAFAPFKTFGGGFSGDGADRGFTTSQNVTSRVKQSVGIDFNQSTPVVSGGLQTSDATHHPILGEDTALSRDALKNVQIGETSTGAKQVSFQSEIEGANPLTPKALTPNIDVDGIFSISSNQETGVLSISANITGDNFPSTESFISDGKNSVFIGVSALKGSPFSSLKGEGGRKMINTDLRINFNSDGIFQNVIYQGKQYNIQDYNKLFETQNPNGNN